QLLRRGAAPGAGDEVLRGSRAAAACERGGGAPRLPRGGLTVVTFRLMATVTSSVADICRAAKRVAATLAQTPTQAKDDALLLLAQALESRTEQILLANEADVQAGEREGMDAALLDRLRLDEARIGAIADAVRQIAALPDPVGELVEGRWLPNGLEIRKVRVPLGVVAVVYE